VSRRALTLEGVAKRYPLWEKFDRLNFQPVEFRSEGVTFRYPLWAGFSRLKIELAKFCSNGVAGCYPMQTTTGGRTS
jgi:hypothetical protein